MTKIAEYSFSRLRVSVYSIAVGFLIGIINVYVPLIEFTFTPGLFGWLVAAVLAVVVLHEGVHGSAAALFGHRPIFGLKPPLVYVTFTTKIPRGQFMAIAIAPFFLLDLLFSALFAAGVLKVFFYFCFIINTLGAVGDLWMTVKLLSHERGTLVQDTKTGFEVWNTG